MKDKLDELNLAELLNTKMCHDLSGPIGAISNGMELLALGDSSMNDKYIELIEDSAFEAKSRILYFRQAFGVCYENSTIGFDKLLLLGNDYFRKSQIKLSWDITNHEMGATIDSTLAKIILNTLLTAASCLIYGGNINVNINKESNSYFIEAKGENAELPAYANNILVQNQEVTLDAKNIQTILLKKIITKYNYVLNISNGNNIIKFELKKGN